MNRITRDVTLCGTNDPTFSRIALLRDGLRQNGVRVDQIVEPAWGSTSDRVQAARAGIANPRLIRRLTRAYARLARRLRASDQRGIFLIGYPGQLDVLVLRLLIPRATIVLDGFVSLDETLADRRLSAQGSPTRRLARILDRLAFRLADLTLVDTHPHARRFTAMYGLDPRRVVVIPVGAPDPGHLPTTSPSETLRVLYFGGFIPLHGVSTILDAARSLSPIDRISIDLVGDGQDADAAASRLQREKWPFVRLIRGWMDERQLIEQHIAQTDVSLGIFDDGPKAMDVVPAKVYLALACGRTVVTADSPAVREEILAHGGESDPPVITCPAGDGAALAATLRQLRDDRALRQRTAASGRKLFEQHFTAAEIVRPLCERLNL